MTNYVKAVKLQRFISGSAILHHNLLLQNLKMIFFTWFHR